MDLNFHYQSIDSVGTLLLRNSAHMHGLMQGPVIFSVVIDLEGLWIPIWLKISIPEDFGGHWLHELYIQCSASYFGLGLSSVLSIGEVVVDGSNESNSKPLHHRTYL